MGVSCDTHAEGKVLAGKPKGHIPLVRYRRRRADNIKPVLIQNMMVGFGLNSSDSGQGQVT
jgi:hypothetical protein